MVFDFFNTLPYGDVVLAAVIIIASVIFSKIFFFVFERSVLRVTAKTKTTLDDEILRALRKPIYIAIILGGVFFAIRVVDILSPYAGLTTTLFMVIWVLLGLFAVTRLINALIRWYGKEIASRTRTHVDDTLLPIVRKILNIFVYAIGLIIILGSLGIEVTPLVAGLGVGGIAVALALQDTLSNLFAGAYVATDKSLKVGDYIELENGMKGYVTEIGWRATKIRTLPNNIVIIPNSKLGQSIITNYYDPETKMAVVIPMGVGYGNDLKKVEKVTVEVAKNVLKDTHGGVKDFEPFIRYSEFGDSNINFSVILQVNEFVDQYLVKHEFIKALKERFDKEGIEISFPVRKMIQG